MDKRLFYLPKCQPNPLIMVDRDLLIKEIDAATERIIHKYQHLPNEQWIHNEHPDRWTPAQILDHLVKTEGMVLEMAEGPSMASEMRLPDGKVDRIRATFGDDGHKLSAMVAIRPDNDPEDMSQLLEQFTTNRLKLVELARTRDLSRVCTGHAHSIFGTLTLLEWTWFVISHGNRHLRHLEHLMPAVR